MAMTTLTSSAISFAVYFLPVLGFIGFLVMRKRRAWSRNRVAWEENVAAGLTEPPSLHPLIDQDLCIGCGVCVPACPEGDVLGMIDGKVHLVNPTQCIGHGACKAICPMDAITLVFGTSKRGMDIPVVDETFQTGVDGLYVAGELGGMGLIRNAVSQGRQAMEAIAKRPGLKDPNMYDVIIVGAGPAGLTASLTAKQLGLRYVTIEQECLGGTVAHFPRGKIVMTAPFELPGVGKFNFREVSKEELLDVWRKVEEQTDVNIRYKEKMDNIQPTDGGFILTTSKEQYATKSILLCIGRRGTPRKLGVPGEEGSPKVVYLLRDPELYRGQKVLVIGGGNSALEAAVSLSEEPGTEVILSYRGGGFSSANRKNRDKLLAAESKGRIQVMMNSVTKEIKPSTVVMEHDGKLIEIENDVVIVNAGGVLPTPFLKQIGIIVETKFGTV